MSSFELKSDDLDFKNRRKVVFDQLLVLERNRRNSSTNDIVENVSDTRAIRKSTMLDSFKGKESIFKKPMRCAPRNFFSRMPDFKKNPHKWTKYSLEDVDDVTEESNTKSAMSFLRELADRKKLESGLAVVDKIKELPQKLVFNKYASKRPRPDEDESSESNKPSYNRSKLVMPEYVVGQKLKKENKPKHKSQKGIQLKLDHLTTYEDE